MCADLLGKLDPLSVSSNAIRCMACCKELCLNGLKDPLYRNVSPVGDFQMTCTSEATIAKTCCIYSGTR